MLWKYFRLPPNSSRQQNHYRNRGQRWKYTCTLRRRISIFRPFLGGFLPPQWCRFARRRLGEKSPWNILWRRKWRKSDWIRSARTSTVRRESGESVKNNNRDSLYSKFSIFLFHLKLNTKKIIIDYFDTPNVASKGAGQQINADDAHLRLCDVNAAEKQEKRKWKIWCVVLYQTTA